MNKCINCAYFLNCENANEENACEKYKFIRKNIERENKNIKTELEKIIEIKNKEREIADLFYELCPHVPPQILGLTVRQTIENFKELENLYNPNIKKDYKSNAIDSIKYANELMLSKDTIIGKPEIPSVIKEQKMLDDNYLNIPRID